MTKKLVSPKHSLSQSGDLSRSKLHLDPVLHSHTHSPHTLEQEPPSRSLETTHILLTCSLYTYECSLPCTPDLRRSRRGHPRSCIVSSVAGRVRICVRDGTRAEGLEIGSMTDSCAN